MIFESLLIPAVKQREPGRVSFSGKQMVRSKTLLIRPFSMTSFRNSRRQISMSLLLLRISTQKVLTSGQVYHFDFLVIN